MTEVVQQASKAEAASIETQSGTGIATTIRDGHVLPRRAGIKISQQILDELSDPGNWDRLKHTFINTRSSAYNLAWLRKLQSETGLHSYNETQTFLVESYVRTKQLALPISTELLFADDRPALLTSGSGTGKTLWTKTRLLPNLKSPTLIIDLAGEYSHVRKIGLPDLFSLKFEKTTDSTRLRFVPSNSSILADAELGMLFDRLNVVKQQTFKPDHVPSGSLQRWVLVAEEGHRLLRSPAFMDFVSESRKYLRKILVISNNAGPLAQICRVLVPPPIEQLLNKMEAK